MCALRDAYIGDGRSSLQKRCLAAATQPPALFVGYRIDCALQFGLPRAGVSTPPPLVSPLGFSPSSGGGIELPRHSSGDGLRVEPARIFITFAAAGSRRTVAAPTYAASCARGPPPRACAARGAPAPSRRPRSLRSRPAGVVGATGERCSLRSRLFFRLPRWGAAAAAGCAERAPASASSGVRPKPRPPADASAASAPVGVLACATRPASPLWSRPRRRRRPPSRTRRSNKNVLGLPKKPLTLRDSRSRPPRNPFFLGTLPATFSFEIEITLAAVGGAAPVNPRPRSARGGTVFFMVFVGLRL